MNAASRIQMIVDCDPGHDDAVALVLCHEHADVLAVTTVSGNAPLEYTTRNALAVVELLGRQTPVYSGAREPLVSTGEKARHATHVHGADGLGGAGLQPPSSQVAGDDAAGFLIEATRSHPGVWIVAIGPLTNVALALQRDPTLAERVAGISIMGGSATVGNVTPVAEFNIWADPEAADVVFRCGAPLRLCGLNLTHQLRSTDATIDQLRVLGSVPGDFVANLLEFLHERMAGLIGERESALHDPCAVLAVTHPQLFGFRAHAVSVELAGTLTRGMTVVDQRTLRRTSRALESTNVEVAFELDSQRAMAVVLDAIAAA